MKDVTLAPWLPTAGLSCSNLTGVTSLVRASIFNNQIIYCVSTSAEGLFSGWVWGDTSRPHLLMYVCMYGVRAPNYGLRSFSHTLYITTYITYLADRYFFFSFTSRKPRLGSWNKSIGQADGKNR